MKTTLALIQNPAVGTLGTGGISSGGSSTTAILGTGIRMLVITATILLVLYLIIGALNWITAEGKPDKLEHARNTVLHAIVGMIVLAASIAITSLIGSALGIQFLRDLNIT